MDHRELLKKYMEHVLQYEGTTFVDTLNRGCGVDVEFSTEEIEELERIEDENME